MAHLGRRAAGQNQSPLADGVRDVPVVRDALAGLFGSSTTAVASATVPYPLDDERVGVATADTTVVCNSISTEIIDIAEDLLCDHLGC